MLSNKFCGGFWHMDMKLSYKKNKSFEDYEINKMILHYSYLVLATNIKLFRYKGRLANKVLWTLLLDGHEKFAV